jgi:hypothetical protein
VIATGDQTRFVDGVRAYLDQTSSVPMLEAAL